MPLGVKHPPGSRCKGSARFGPTTKKGTPIESVVATQPAAPTRVLLADATPRQRSDAPAAKPAAMASPMPVLLADDDATRVAADVAGAAGRCAAVWPVAELVVQVQVAADGRVTEVRSVGDAGEAGPVPCVLTAVRAARFSVAGVPTRTGLLRVPLPTFKPKNRRPARSTPLPANDTGDWSL